MPRFIAILLFSFLARVSDTIGVAQDLSATPHWRYTSPSGATEIAAYSAEAGRLYVTANAGIEAIELVSGKFVEGLPCPAGFHATSVAHCDGTLAVAWAAIDKRQLGRITFYDAQTLQELTSYSAGYLPDMLTFTPDGKHLLAANEGEPSKDYTFDPEGSVTIITAGENWQDAKVREARFTEFNALKENLIAAGVRVFGPKASNVEEFPTVAQDLEPEYLTVSPDSKLAWVTLQENNAIAQVDIAQAEIVGVYPFGVTEFRTRGSGRFGQLVSASAGTGLDVSNGDGGIRIRHWPIAGMFQPDGIAVFQQEGDYFLVTANEGDPRDYANYTEAVQIGSLAEQGILVAHNNPARTLINNTDLARLEISRAAGDWNDDGALDQFVCFGTRSFSIWRQQPDALELVFDSGNDFEQIIAREAPHLFNVDSTPFTKPDERSTTRGPEPESVALFTCGRRRIAAVGLERTGGMMFYDISSPQAPKFLGFLQPDADAARRDLAPEGLLVIAANQNPHLKPLLVACNEASGTVTAYLLSLNPKD